MWDFFSQVLLGPEVSLAEIMTRYWPVMVVAFVLSLYFTPIAWRLAFKFRILDMPDDSVKIHKQPTAYLGGVAIMSAFVIASFAGLLLMNQKDRLVQFHLILSICGGAALACLIGLIDDIKDISPYQKLAGQAICSIFLVLGGIKPGLYPFFHLLGINIPPVLHDILAYLTVLFFVLGASNSLNLLDGLDGLCTGVTSIITIGFLLLALHLATWGTAPVLDPVRIVVAMSLFGASMGFLIFNRHPAKIFLGDAGSIFLGFVLATMMMLFATKNPRWWFASVLIFGLPILDTGTALIRRALNKHPLFKSDRGHIYDQMIDRGLSLKMTVFVNFAVAGILALAGLMIAVLFRARYAILLDIFIFLACFIILGWKGYFKMEGLRGAIHRKDADKSE